MAKDMLRDSSGLYKEVEIVSEDGTTETIPAAAVSSQVPPAEILLVEDNAGDALLVGQALAECRTQVPVHLHIARDGAQALQILGENDFEPDLIILDLNIPKISGFAVLASYPLKKAPVVVFTASENQADTDRALNLGAFECVHKPLDLDDYKTAVCGMVQRWVASPDDQKYPKTISM